jgi:membrane dipeptidase
MKISQWLYAIAAGVLIGCSGSSSTSDEAVIRAKADELARKFIFVDTHVDLPDRLKEINFAVAPENMGILSNSKEGDFDFERAKKGGLDAPFMSIYIPSRYQTQPDQGKLLADSLMDMVDAIIAALPDKFAHAGSPQEVITNTHKGKISLPYGMENGAPIGDSLENIQYFFDRGIRYITLTHGKDNQICDSSYDTLNTWNGLSPFGEKVVEEMNRVGIMVDISHASDNAFFDVMKIVRAPVIASHSSCRRFTPGFQRNMSDDMIMALGENGGVIQINFGASFLDSLARANGKLLDSLEATLKDKGLLSRDPEAQPIINQFTNNPVELYADVERVVDHIDHVVKLIGIDHVGIGSDFDGVGDSLPLGLKDVADYPNLIYVLLKRGYTEQDIEKICSGNIMRVWNKVIEVAKSE